MNDKCLDALHNRIREHVRYHSGISFEDEQEVTDAALKLVAQRLLEMVRIDALIEEVLNGR